MFEILVIILLVAILGGLAWMGAGMYYLSKALSGVELIDAQGQEMPAGLEAAAQRAKKSHDNAA